MDVLLMTADRIDSHCVPFGHSPGELTACNIFCFLINTLRCFWGFATFVWCQKTHFCWTFPQFVARAPLILVMVGAATATTGAGVATGAATAVVGSGVTNGIVVTGFIGVTSGAGVMAATPAAAAAAAAVAAAAVAALAADSAAAAAAEMLEMEALGDNVVRRGAMVSVSTNGMAGTSDILGRATLCGKCQIWNDEGLHVSAPKQCSFDSWNMSGIMSGLSKTSLGKMIKT